MVRGRVRSWVAGVLCAALVLAVLPLHSFSAEVDKKTAADPTAVLADIEAMNLPDMPEEFADQLRGGGWFELLWSVYKLSSPIRSLYSAYQSSNFIGWELGRRQAISAGMPDPGPRPDATMLQRAIYWAANRLL